MRRDQRRKDFEKRQQRKGPATPVDEPSDDFAGDDSPDGGVSTNVKDPLGLDADPVVPKVEDRFSSKEDILANQRKGECVSESNKQLFSTNTSHRGDNPPAGSAKHNLIAIEKSSPSPDQVKSDSYPRKASGISPSEAEKHTQSSSFKSDDRFKGHSYKDSYDQMKLNQSSSTVLPRDRKSVV